MTIFKGNNGGEMGVFGKHISGLPKTARMRFLGRGGDGFKMVKAGGNAHALQTKNHQRRSRLRKCSFTAFSPVSNYSNISEAGNIKLPAFYNEVIV